MSTNGLFQKHYHLINKTLAKGETYNWENVTIDDNFLNQLASKGKYNLSKGNAEDQSGILKFLIGSNDLGAQQAENAYQLMNKVNTALQQKWETAVEQLKQIDPYFDPSKYIDPSYQLYNPGEGADSNRSAPLLTTAMTASAQLEAINKATQAAQKYQQTGNFEPYPDYKTALQAELARTQNLLNSGVRNADATAYASKLNNLISGTELSDDVKAQANASAARVGAPLPYPDGGIGEIAPGGVFQDSQAATQAYTNGQLNTVGQNIVNSNSAGNTKDGVNQVTTNADGTLSWNGQTFKTREEAIKAASAAGIGSLRFSDGTTSDNPANTTPSGTSTTNGTTNTTGGTVNADGTVTYNDPAAQANSMAILNKYLNDGTIDSGTYQFFKTAVESWNPEQQVDYANILNTFETIKNTDINPYFKEQADLFINDLQTNRQYLQDTRAFEVQQEGEDRAKLKENMQKDLQARGMLFTGEGVKQLGEEGVYAVAGTDQANQSAIPTIQPFGNSELQKQSQAAASSNSLRYEKSLKDLAQQAESYLGTTGSAGLIPGVTQIGGITGTLENEKKSAQASTLSNLYEQQQQNVAAQAPVKIFNE